MVSVVIPAYNEGKYLLKLIDDLKKATLVKEIILVDDCSEDTYSDLYKNIQDIRLIRHNKNTGKSKSIYDGYIASKYNNILFLDADLQGVTSKMIDELLYFAQNYDVISIIRGGDYKIAKIIGSTYLTLGERYINKQILMENEKILFDNTRWGFDNNINDLLATGKYKYAYCELAGVSHIMKSQKYGFIKGMWEDFKMVIQVIVFKYKIFHFLRFRLYFWSKIKSRIIIYP
jgi:hypothetical protein